MNDKERLNEIITRYKNVKPFEIYSDTGIISMIQMDEKDKDWLIARAEKAEQLEHEIELLKKENTEFRRELSLLCPIGDLPVIQSLLIQKEMYMERIKQLEEELKKRGR